ncbi:MAG: ATP-binding cassette domain-containing protein [Candidatus Cloacimonadota bacterium]|nr:ATP-binding cassette domain-containing protein [Candidatus Cloacimonadota bacterium]
MSIIFDNVTFSYKIPSPQDVLHEFSFQVNGGEKLGIFKQSGWGKSTLVKLITGEEKLESGRIIIAGYEKQNWKKMFSNLSILFQEPDKQFVFPNLKDEYEFLTENENNKSRGKKINTTQKMDELARIFEFDLQKYISENRTIFSVSSEERKILQILFTISGEEEYLIMDDPLLYLSEKSQQQFLNYLSEIDKTILILARDKKPLRKVF